MRLRLLDFFFLLAWWLYLYLFIVIPWQYVSPNEAMYGRSFDLLYAGEQIVMMVGVGLVWRRSEGSWRNIYRQLFKAALLYGVGSILAGVAIDFHQYYTGSIYDVPLVAAMAWFVAVGFDGARIRPGRGSRNRHRGPPQHVDCAFGDDGCALHSADGGVGRVWRKLAGAGALLPDCC